MGMTQFQRAIVEKARSVGGGELGVTLSDGACAFLVATIARDLGVLGHFPEFLASGNVPDFFSQTHPEELVIPGIDPYPLLERLFGLVPDADAYFSCLASLHKSRLKYARILERHRVPTMDQVGPRSLLQYGMMSAKALAGLLLWRKWLSDIDNRAGQETGYLFEPILSCAIGGVAVSAKKSPVRRHDDPEKGRQVDCIRDKHAYEIKLRVTIAASGQGRWKEELDFPVDCRQSGYTPVLLVLDPTPSPKLDELREAFLAQDGEVYVGDEVWSHLEEVAGETMNLFLKRYVREPLEQVLAETPEKLPSISFDMGDTAFTVTIGSEKHTFRREAGTCGPDEDALLLPDDVDEETPGI